MRISDWSSGVCSSDLGREALVPIGHGVDDAVRLCGRGDVLALALPCQLEGVLEDAIGAAAGEAGKLRDHFLIGAGVEASADFGIFALDVLAHDDEVDVLRSEEHTSELQSLMRISYAVFCLNKKKE